MAKYLIEVPHEANKTACFRAAQTLHKTGSHFLTNADFGCLDGEHKAWITVDVPDKESQRTCKLSRDLRSMTNAALSKRGLSSVTRY
jgi:hypothetical protein